MAVAENPISFGVPDILQDNYGSFFTFKKHFNFGEAVASKEFEPIKK